jgi:hypothetical protein
MIRSTYVATSALAAAAVAGSMLTGAPAASLATLTCTAVGTTHQAAPAVGASTTVQASPAGSYTVTRSSTTTLEASNAVPASGWNATIPIPSGTRVRATFTSTTTSDVYRSTTKLNSTGTTLITHLVHCS